MIQVKNARLLLVCALLFGVHNVSAMWILDKIKESAEDVRQSVKKTAEDADFLTRAFDTHDTLSKAYHRAKDSIADTISRQGSPVLQKVAAGVTGLSSLFFLTRGNIGAVGHLIALAASGGIAWATYLNAPDVIKKHPELAVHLYPSVAGPYVTREVVELAARGYCFVRKPNVVAIGGAALACQGNHADTAAFIRSVCGL